MSPYQRDLINETWYHVQAWEEDQPLEAFAAQLQSGPERFRLTSNGLRRSTAGQLTVLNGDGG